MEGNNIYIINRETMGNVENKPSFYQYKDVKENGHPRKPSYPISPAGNHFPEHMRGRANQRGKGKR